MGVQEHVTNQGVQFEERGGGGEEKKRVVGLTSATIHLFVTQLNKSELLKNTCL